MVLFRMHNLKTAAAAIFLLIIIYSSYSDSFPKVSPYTLDLVRGFTREIFESNGVPYLTPLVQSMNSTSNSRFFNNAYVPEKTDKVYFKFSIQSMMGFVRDDQKTYTPIFPNEPLDINKLNKLIQFDFSDPSNPKVVAIPDTAALILYALKVYANRGIEDKSITPPTSSATILGKDHSEFVFPRRVLDSLMRSYPGDKALYDYLPESVKATISTALNQFPGTFALPQGADISLLAAAVPQLEIGSLYGTELLLRFIPPVYMGENIGDFAFWGIGFKHSISQYFEERWFDLAFQAVYQGTNLKNEVGITNAQLEANATIWDVNIHASKTFDEWLTVFSGFSYEHINISSSYIYYIPVETQWQLGLIEYYVHHYDQYGNEYRVAMNPNPPDFPGDTKPQSSSLSLKDDNYKFVLGATVNFDSFSFVVDYSFSKFNILSAGLEVRF